jgi:transposase
MTTTNKQVKLMMRELLIGTLKRAALKSEMSEKTARKYRRAKALPSELKTLRNYRTREDPFLKNWAEIEAMLGRTPELQAKTIMTYLTEKHPDDYKPEQVRSLQRRLQLWRAESGKNKPVIFRQILKPGAQSQSDWTHMGALKITIGGEEFPHLLYHFMLPYSRFETVMICKSESFETLTRGYEQAVLELGGSCAEHRTDNLTAATQAMGNTRIFTKRWQEFMNHYNVKPSANNPGVSNENGSVEKSHDTLKTAIDQYLMLRGYRDFKRLEDYQSWLNNLINKRNLGRRHKIIEEHLLLKTLPEKRFNEATILKVRVSPSSTIQVYSVTYSVPSRLIGLWLKATVFRDEIQVSYGQKNLLTLPRALAGICIDYRHIIDSLLRKPGAFAQYQYRAALFPTPIFRRAYDELQTQTTTYNKRYLELLHLAKMEGEADVSLALELLLEAGKAPLKPDILELLAQKRTPKIVAVSAPNLGVYDQLHSFSEAA